MTTVSKQGDPSVEYSDVAENMRHYANLRFVQMTLFFTYSAGAFAVVATVTPPIGATLRLVVMAVSVVVSVAFSIIEERSSDHWHHFRRRAKVLEAQLGYEQYSSRPTRKLVSATNAVRLLHWGSALGWAAALAIAAFECKPVT